MPRGGKRQNAGRPSLLEANIKALVMDRSWDILFHYLGDENNDLKDRVRVASVLASKAVPQDINVGGQKDNPIKQEMVVRWQS
jgi:hypothetical protein